MAEAHAKYVFLIKVSAATLREPDLARWIEEIEQEYMNRFGGIGSSLAHIKLDDGPWDFALVFPGSEASVRYLTEEISRRSPGQTECLAMRGRDLDEFRADLRKAQR